MSSPDSNSGSDTPESSRCDEEELTSGTIGTGATTDDDPSVGAETDNAEVEKTTLASRDEGGQAISLVERKRRKYRFLDGKSLEGTSVSSVGAISGVSIVSDMCRICHMGNPPSVVSMSRNRSRSFCGEALVDSQSIFSLGLLVSACRCRGTVGLVHTKCLERWLTESGNSRCEICGYRYATIRVPRHGIFRSMLMWLKSFVGSRQMLIDSLYLVVTTPLAIFSAHVCALTLKLALENRFKDIPWMVVAMLPACIITLGAYWGWLLTLRRLHGRRWRQYWQSNFVIRLLPNIPVREEANTQTTDVSLLTDDELYENFQQLFEII